MLSAEFWGGQKELESCGEAHPHPTWVSGSEVTGASMVMSGATSASFLSCCLAMASFPKYLNLGPLSPTGWLQLSCKRYIRDAAAMLLL